MRPTDASELNKAEEILEKYLKEHKLRKTPERFEILKVIHQFYGPYDINKVKNALEDSPFKPSLSTIYNTIILFEKASLIFRSKPNGRYSKFITNFKLSVKHYMVCNHCGNVQIIPNTKIEKSITNAKWSRFKFETYTLFIQGICMPCLKKLEKEEKKRKQQSSI